MTVCECGLDNYLPAFCDFDEIKCHNCGMLVRIRDGQFGVHNYILIDNESKFVMGFVKTEELAKEMSLKKNWSYEKN